MSNKNTTISPSIAAFAILIVAFAVVGLYVKGLDIKTEGVTAQEVLLPNVAPAAEDAVDSDISLRYPQAWAVSQTLTNGFLVQPLDEEKAASTAISVQIVEQPLNQVMAGLKDQDPNIDFEAYPNPIDPILDGQKYTFTQEATQPNTPRITNDIILLALADGRTVQGVLQASANDIGSYRKTFEMMLSNLDVTLVAPIEVPARDTVAAPELTSNIDSTGTIVSLAIPADWQALPIASASAAGVSASPTASETATELQVFLLDPATTAVNLGIADPLEDTSPAAILERYKVVNGVRLVEDVTASTLNGHDGAKLITRDGASNNISEVGIYPYSDGVYLSYILRSTVDNLPQDFAVADAILASVTEISLPEVGNPDTSLAAELSESHTGVLTGISLNYPSGWIVEDSPNGPVMNVQPNAPLASAVTILVTTPEDTLTQFQVASASELSPNTVIEAILSTIPAEVLLRPISDYQAGDYTGKTFAIRQGGVAGQVPQLVEVAIVGLPDGRYLSLISSTLLDAASVEFRATVNAIIASVELNTSESTDEGAETDTSSEDTDTSEAGAIPSTEIIG